MALRRKVPQQQHLGQLSSPPQTSFGDSRPRGEFPRAQMFARALFVSCLAASLAAGFTLYAIGLAAAEPDILSSLVDGRRSAFHLLDFYKSFLVIPRLQGRSTTDLAAARMRWGIDAQIEKLRRSRPEEESSFSIAVIGDAERGRFAWERVFSPGANAFADQLGRIHALGPDFVFQLGDFVSRGSAKNYRRYVDFLDARVTLPLFSVIGNHDRSRPNGPADKTLYDTVFGKRDFYFDYNGWRFIGLDTSDRRLTRDQIAWLGQTLETDLRKIIFTHVPPKFLERDIRSEANLSDSPRPEGYLPDLLAGYFTEGSQEFDDLVSSRRVDRVYMGHLHAFGVASHRGVRYVLTGGGGSPLYPLPPGYPQRKMAHFILAKLGPDGVRETVYPLHDPAFSLP